jgi:hypothetical protein
MIFCSNNSQLAQSVKHLAQNSNPDLPWTMTITRVKSGGYYVSDVTSSEWDATEELTSECLNKLSNTSTETTPVG